MDEYLARHPAMIPDNVAQKYGPETAEDAFRRITRWLLGTRIPSHGAFVFLDTIIDHDPKYPDLHMPISDELRDFQRRQIEVHARGDGRSRAVDAPSMGLNLPTKLTDPKLFIPRESTSKPPPPPPLITNGKTQPLAEGQKIDGAPKKGASLKKSQTFKTMQEIVIEEAAKKAAEEKERQRRVRMSLPPCCSCPLIGLSCRT